jgi:hypothetical protein
VTITAARMRSIRRDKRRTKSSVSGSAQWRSSITATTGARGLESVLKGPHQDQSVIATNLREFAGPGRLNQLAYRAQRDRHGERLACASDVRDPLIQAVSQRPHQRGLADAGLAAHQHDAPRADGGLSDRPGEDVKLVVALEQAHLGRDRNAGVRAG